MNCFLWIDALGLAASFLLTCLAAPCFMRLARRIGFLDVPKTEGHKLHARAVPLLGGAAMCVGWLSTALAGAAVILYSERVPLEISAGFRRESVAFIAVCACALASVLLGAADDRRPMGPGRKLLGQLAIALAATIFGGIRITLFVDSAWFSVPVTTFWILFLFNALNFFDNMDGLAAGTGAIAFAFFGIMAHANGQFFVAALCACSCGATLGFWIFNRAPAKIFMGDSGSHLIGFLLAAVSAKTICYNPAMSATKISVLIPLFILAVPIFDTLAVVAIRLWTHRPIYCGDNNHISHRFVRMGLSRAAAVRIVHLLCVMSGLGALPLLWGDVRTCVVLLIQGCVLLLLLSLLQYAGAFHSKGEHE